MDNAWFLFCPLHSPFFVRSGCLAWVRTRTSGVRDRHAADYATRHLSMECGMGSSEWTCSAADACRFQIPHSALRIWTGCRGWTRTITLAFKGRCPAIRRPGIKVRSAECIVQNGRRCASRARRVSHSAFCILHLTGGRERTCTSKAHRLSICGVCSFPLNHSPERSGAPGRNPTGNHSLRRAGL